MRSIGSTRAHHAGLPRVGYVWGVEPLHDVASDVHCFAVGEGPWRPVGEITY